LQRVISNGSEGVIQHVSECLELRVDPYDGVILGKCVDYNQGSSHRLTMIEQRECVWVDDTRALWAGYTSGPEVYVLLQPIFTIYHNLTFFSLSVFKGSTALLVTLLHQPTLVATARIPPGRGTGQINFDLSLTLSHFLTSLGF
jgi:hypothetical protein